MADTGAIFCPCLPWVFELEGTSFPCNNLVSLKRAQNRLRTLQPVSLNNATQPPILRDRRPQR